MLSLYPACTSGSLSLAQISFYSHLHIVNILSPPEPTVHGLKVSTFYYQKPGAWSRGQKTTTYAALREEESTQERTGGMNIRGEIMEALGRKPGNSVIVEKDPRP